MAETPEASVSAEEAVPGSAPVTGEQNEKSDAEMSVMEVIADEIAKSAIPEVKEEEPAKAADAEREAAEEAEKITGLEGEEPAEEVVKSLDTDPASVKMRIDKLNAKLSGERESLEQLKSDNEMLISEMKILREKAKLADEFELAAKFDSRIRQIRDEHPILGKNKRAMTLEDFEGDAESYASYREEMVRRETQLSSTDIAAQKEAADKYVVVLDESEKRCQAHPIYKQFMDEKNLKTIDAEIVSAYKAGRPYKSFEQALQVLFHEKIVAAIEKQASEKASGEQRTREGKKLSQLVPGSGRTHVEKEPDFSKMTTLEMIDYEIAHASS